MSVRYTVRVGPGLIFLGVLFLPLVACVACVGLVLTGIDAAWQRWPLLVVFLSLAALLGLVVYGASQT